MDTVTLKPLFHKGQNCIGIYFENKAILNGAIQKYAGAKWSNTNKCWYVPLTQKDYRLLSNSLLGKAILQTVELKNYLLKTNKGAVSLPTNDNIVKPVAPKHLIKTAPQQTKPAKVLSKLSAENQAALEQFIQKLYLKAYSPSTIKTYRNELMQLLQLLKNKPVNALTAEDLKRYMVYILQKEKLTENTAHSRLNALKFYFEQVLGREKFFWEIPRPKKPLQLPKLLNEEELRKLFNALTNKKHKAMLFTAYSAGLRVSEIVNLRIKDIDSKRMQIFIERAKGKKDRYVNLSPVLLDILRNYIKLYSPKPKVFLFESEQTGNCYPIRTVQQIFANAKIKAGIKKDVGVHSLRHSFATHLLDKGTDIRFIKDLLGHFDIRTTERYLHVSKQKLVNIVSPLDDLMQKEEIDW
jgi:integrase/recombinase XerD